MNEPGLYLLRFTYKDTQGETIVSYSRTLVNEHYSLGKGIEDHKKQHITKAASVIVVTATYDRAVGSTIIH